MRILLTGPGGFLGSALASHWARCGHELILLARPTSRLDRLPAFASSAQVVRAESAADIRQAVVAGSPDVIVHTACAYGRKGETPMDVLAANLLLGASLLQAVLDGPDRDSVPVTVLNTGTVLAPEVSLYARSKTQFSDWGAAVATQHADRLRFIDIRLQQMYGPGDDPSKFTTHVIDACRRNDARLALTAGEQLRDFIHIDDVVHAYDQILMHRDAFASSDSVDVGSGEAISMRSFVELVKRVTGAATELDFGAVPYRAHEAMHCVADTGRLQSLGWHARISLLDGLTQLSSSAPTR